MTGTRHDLRYALRSLGRSPGWTVAAVLTLALGVAANTTVFSWVRSVVLQPIPGAAQAGRLRVVFARTPAGEVTRLSYPDYQDLSRRTDVLSGLVAQQWITVGMGANRAGPSQVLSCALVSANYFQQIGASPGVGRGFRPEEESGRGAPPVAVISHALWERAFGSDPGVVGRAVILNAQPFTIVGVAPAGFYGSFLGIGTDVWIPLVQFGRFETAGDRLTDRGSRWLLTLARLKPGISTERARAALEAEAARLNRDFPGLHDGYGIGVTSLARSPWGSPAELGPIVLTLAALVSLVLLTACANVANLLVNRALGRRREIAVRLALGASRGRIARQLVIEAVVLSLLACALATVATVWTSGLLLAFIPPTGMPVRMALGVDLGIVLFALGVSLAATLLFGLIPSLQASRTSVAGDLGGGDGRVAGVRGRARLRRALVAAQTALSLVLLAAGGLFLRSLTASLRRDPGFDSRRLLLVDLKLTPAGYDLVRGAALLNEVIQRAPQIAGVRAAALARRPPLGFGGFPSASVAVEGYAARRGEELRVRTTSISPGYFQLMRVAISRGREFALTDRADTEPVAVVNEAFARRYLAGREAIGARVQSQGIWRRVVGVAADFKYEKLGEPPLPFLFAPIAQVYTSEVCLHVRTDGDPLEALPAVREMIRRFDPNLPLFEVQTMDQHLGEELFAQRIGSGLLGGLGLLAALISSIGLYAVAAYSVAERRREIGVRMALGAGPRQLLASFLGQALLLAAAGVAAGLVGALAVGRLIASQLPGIAPADPLTFGAVSLAILAVSLAASYLPARRAARLDPMTALRSE